MKKIIFENYDKVLQCAENGKTLMIYEVDDNRSPIIPISEIKIQNNEIQSKGSDIIKPAIHYIHNNFTKELRLDSLAEMCDISISHLCRIFNKRYGKGIISYIIELRLEKACLLLSQTENTVVSIALDVGYVDCGYFNKLFKKHIGCTPLEYRKKSKEAGIIHI